MPNPWDRGSAKQLERLGFKALATTSAGFAYSRGLPDTVDALSREAVLEHVAEIVAATELPVSADFQNAYATDARGVEESVRLCVEAGVAGLSIEDASGDRAKPLYDLETAVERVRAARRAIDRSQQDVLLTARAECFLVGTPEPLAESIRRLRAYAAAGADVLFAPGLRDRESIRAVVDAVAPKPVNVVMQASFGMRAAELAQLGVRRLSVGSGLARVAWTAFTAAAKKIADEGDFTGLDGILSNAEISRWWTSR
jgi:2-methylisocitrate lyase-like PEP mutase family enzyme